MTSSRPRENQCFDKIKNFYMKSIIFIKELQKKSCIKILYFCKGGAGGLQKFGYFQISQIQTILAHDFFLAFFKYYLLSFT